MDFQSVVLKRRMVRHFQDRPLPPGVIERIVQLTRRAPSAGFTQGQSFVVVTRPELKQEIASLCGEAGYVESGFHPFVSGAPALLVPCVSEEAYHRRYREPDKVMEDRSEIEWPVPFWFMDIGCAVMIALLAAVDEGLAGAFAGVPDLAALKALLAIPD
jgi:nitroreductase